MSRRWTDIDIAATVGWEAQNWPEPMGLAWESLHYHLKCVRQIVADFDDEVGRIDQDRKLSEEGKLEKRRNAAQKYLRTLSAPKTLDDVEKDAADKLNELTAKMAVKKPADPYQAARIQDYIAMLPQTKRFGFVKEQIRSGDVTAAIFNGPAFLTGLSDNERDLLRIEYEEVNFPTEKLDRDRLAKAMAVAKAAGDQAVRMAASRVGLTKKDGQWVPVETPGPTAPVPNTYRPAPPPPRPSTIC